MFLAKTVETGDKNRDDFHSMEMSLVMSMWFILRDDWNNAQCLSRLSAFLPCKKNRLRFMLMRGAPNANFRENICLEDYLRASIFGPFVVKFLACLPLLRFPNIYKMV